MANTTIDPVSPNTTRWYDTATINIPDSDWCFGMWYRPNAAEVAARVWATGGASDPQGMYARVSHGGAGTGIEQQFGFRFIANDDTGVPVVDTELGPNYVTGWPVDSDYLLIVQRRSGNLELHVCEKGGATYSTTPAAWTLGARTSGIEFILGGRQGGNYANNPYGEFFFLSGASLSTANINTLKAGAAITAVTATPTRYYKLRESNDPEPDLGTAGANADQNGTGWTLDTEFFTDSAGNASLVVDNASLALAGQDVNLTNSTSASLVVDSNSIALTGQEIPFQYTVPEDGDAAIVLEGQGITLMAGADTPLTVEENELALAGQDINLLASANIPIDIGQLALTGQDVTMISSGNVTVSVDSGSLALARSAVSMTATGQSATDENLLFSMVRPFVKDMTFEPVDIARGG